MTRTRQEIGDRIASKCISTILDRNALHLTTGTDTFGSRIRSWSRDTRGLCSEELPALRDVVGAKQTRDAVMLGWALMFLILALIAGYMGFFGLAGLAANIAQVLLVVFLVLLVVSLVSNALRGRPPPL